MTEQDEMGMVVAQPRLWIEAMLEEYDRARTASAKSAILGRVGAVLVATFAVSPEPRLLTCNEPEHGAVPLPPERSESK